jgi:hypothetical protein
MRTVLSSVLLTVSMEVSRPFMSEVGCRARSRENTTSSAVKALPLWNFTPWRSLNSHTVGSSSLICQDRASVGSILPVRSRTISGS